MFVDPPVVWNGADTEVAVYAVDVVAPVQVVSIVPAGSSNETRLTFEPTDGHPDRPNAIVPKGTAPGVYDVILRDAGTGCTEQVDGGLTISDDASLNLTGVEPSVGFGPEATQLAISASGAGFDNLPTVFLTSDALAKPVRLGGVASLSPASLVAETPAGLAEGTYSVVVVNADGTAGVLENGFRVSVTAPPTVTAISPKQVPTGTNNAAIAINGANFRNATVKYQCHGPAGNAFPEQNATIANQTASTINATINTTGHSAGANCNVIVTNGGDNARTVFTSLVVVTPQQNLTNFTAGPDLGGPRQFLSSVAGTAGKSRFVYAIGGDNGSNPLRSVEVLAVDGNGRPSGTWFTQRNQLDEDRTELGATRVGRFIYALGGTSVVGQAVGALASVERAVILEPSEAPQQVTANYKLTRDNKGLEGGTYYYRVAAVLSGNDKNNPNGETLASTHLGVMFRGRVQVELSWMPVENATRYRIYRTLVNGAAGSEMLIADTNELPDQVTCSGPTSCTDLGATPDMEANPPLLLGSTGRWVELEDAAMDNPRRGVGLASAIDPNDPTKAYLYAIGGMDDSGTVLGTYEYLPITINADGSQDYTTWVPGATSFGTPRWRIGAYAVTRADSARVDGTYIWAGGGERQAANSIVGDFDGAGVQPGGQLGTFTTAVNPTTFSGYGAFAAGDYLYVLGGQNGQPATANLNVQLSATCSPCSLTGFQSFTPGMNTPRVGPGSASQSGYFYIVGGGSGGGVLTSTEFVLY